jgi:hypothetical protein
VRKAHISWAVGAVAALVLGIALFVTRPFGSQITACGFDAQGAYAKVRINNLLGGTHEQELEVIFYVKGSDLRYGGMFGANSSDVVVPAHGRLTKVVYGGFPPRNTTVEGRTIYSSWHGKGTMPDDPNILRCDVGVHGD